MIIRREGQWLECYRQTDHAASAAAIAQSLAPRSVDPALAVETIRLHDAGWEMVDLHPALLPDGRPRDFLSMPAGEAAATWRRSIEIVHERLGALSAWVVSRHFTRLAAEAVDSGSRRGGEAEALGRFVAQQTALQAQWEALWPPTDRQAASELGELLQLVDSINVLLLTSSETHGKMRLKRVEVALNGSGALRFDWPRPRQMSVDPWPFAQPVIELTIPCTVLPDRPYADNDDLRHALKSAPREERVYWLREE